MASLVVLLLCSAVLFTLLPLLVNSVANVDGPCKEETPSMFPMTFTKNCRSLSIAEDKCNQAYSDFLGAFSNRDPTSVQQENYNPYFNTLPIMADKDESLFWSGTFSLVSILSMMESMGVKIVSSENTASGRILNLFNMPNLCWCSALGNMGLVLDSVCPKAPTSLFWAQFSVRFAEAASGTIYFLADGERNPMAYNPSSFFGCYELVSLNTSMVKRVVTLNVHRKGEGEACNTGSLTTLRENVTSLQLQYACYDLYGQASDTDQTQAIAKCVERVIGSVQNGTESGQFQFTCSGAKFLEASLLVLLIFVGCCLFLEWNRIN